MAWPRSTLLSVRPMMPAPPTRRMSRRVLPRWVSQRSLPITPGIRNMVCEGCVVRSKSAANTAREAHSCHSGVVCWAGAGKCMGAILLIKSDLAHSRVSLPCCGSYCLPTRMYDHFQPEKLLAAGPGAKIYRGVETATGRKVLIKALLADHEASHPYDRERLQLLAPRFDAAPASADRRASSRCCPRRRSLPS
jgi:hypothetical protein